MDLFGRKRRIAQLEESLEEQRRLCSIMSAGWRESNRDANLTINKLTIELRTYQRAVGRIIGKMDPTFTDDPFDPKVKARSDAIGEAVIERLRGEVIASNKMIGDR